MNTSKAFYDRLKVFLNTSSGSRFVDDVLWSDTGKDIKVSRQNTFVFVRGFYIR